MHVQSRPAPYAVHGVSAAISSTIAAWAGEAFALLRRRIAAIATRLAAQDDIARLSEMEDHMLQDVGLARRDISAAVLGELPDLHAR